ncbi:MAG: DNA methylase [Lachnospiraceae bacterium]|nr:DNA methylase [Lachnospiraceae bacterium]
MSDREERIRTYVAIDLKSFYASVECVDRGFDPLGVNLVVADPERTEKTICLAVSPSLKAYGISGRARLFEVVEKVKLINAKRRAAAPNKTLTGSSYIDAQLKADKTLAVDYVTAPPRMGRYVEMSRKICGIYRKFISPEDIHVYSVDEIFADVTDYLKFYGVTARELTMRMIRAVLEETGITATAGIGSNMFLCKIAMDIVAKHMEPDADGVRLAELDEMSFRKTLWTHKPITDFWMIGRGIARRLENLGIYTMGDIARCSIGKPGDFYNEELLYKTFGVNAQLIIDHAWGYEPCTIAAVKACKPKSKSLSTGQVLKEPYPFDKARIVIREMADKLVLELVEKGYETDRIVIDIGYDTENISIEGVAYEGDVVRDYYGRMTPAPAHATVSLGCYTCSSRLICDAVAEAFDRIANPALTVRRLNIAAGDLVGRDETESMNGAARCEGGEGGESEATYEQMSFFDIHGAQDEKSMATARAEEKEKKAKEKEYSLQKAVVNLQKRYGKNAVLKGMNLEEGATAIERNGQIGGHRA